MLAVSRNERGVYMSTSASVTIYRPGMLKDEFLDFSNICHFLDGWTLKSGSVSLLYDMFSQKNIGNFIDPEQQCIRKIVFEYYRNVWKGHAFQCELFPASWDVSHTDWK